LARKALIETRSIGYVPLRERHGRAWHLWPVWFSGDAHLATLATGMIGVAQGLNLLWAAVAILGGCALGTFFMAFHAAQGPQLGLPQMIQSRPQFGYRGALLVWVVALVTYVGYNAVNQVLAGQTLQLLTGIDSRVAFLLFSFIAAALAVVGYDWIHAAQRTLAAVLLLALAAYSLGAVVTWHMPAAQFSPAGFMMIPFLTQFFAAAAYQLSWSIYVSDYSRYLPRDVGVRAAFWWTFTGALIGGAWMMFVGMVAAAGSPGRDLAVAVRAAGDAVHPGFGAILLLASLLGLVTVTSLNFYGGSLTLLSMADSFGKLRAGVRQRLLSLAVVAAASTTIALFSSNDFVARFSDMLAVLLYLFTPWTAINLVDFYLVRRGHYSVREIFNPYGLYGQWNWRGLVAYGGGFLAMVPFFSTGLYTGPVAARLGGADIAMLVGLPVSAGIYLLACRSMDVVGDRRLADAADLGLEGES
jgi:nucleobase:cation symporter-1, NCS1 family